MCIQRKRESGVASRVRNTHIQNKMYDSIKKKSYILEVSGMKEIRYTTSSCFVFGATQTLASCNFVAKCTTKYHVLLNFISVRSDHILIH